MTYDGAGTRELHGRLETAWLGGGAERIARQHAEGRLTARERIDLLLDPGTFVEFDALVARRCREGLNGRPIPGDGVIGGYGTMAGRLVYVFAQDFTVFGGSLSEANTRKICKVLDLALENGAPVIGLHDSGGARIQEGIDALAGCADVFLRHTLASGVIPQIGAVLGPCLGSAVFSPALSDFLLMVAGTSQMFLTGPDLMWSVQRGDVSPEELGGTAVHSRTGVCHFNAPNEAACLATIRELLSYLPSNNLDAPPSGRSADDPAREDPELDSLVPADPSKPYDMRRLIQAVMDDCRFLEVQEIHARNLVVGFGHVARRSVGVVANQPAHLAGVLDIDASLKGARFVRFCDAFNIPLLTFVDVPGFLPGTRQEIGGIIKHGAKLIYAYAEATVPKITVIVRKAYGGAYAVMGSKHLRTDVNLAFPSAEIAVMGPEGAVNILHGSELRCAGEGVAELRQARIAEYRARFSNPYAAAERGYIDQIIEPRRTRLHVTRALWQLSGKRTGKPARKHGNIPL